MSTTNRGFASMPLAEVKRIAALGGVAAHRKGTAHQWTPEEARLAGRKGSIASRVRRPRGPLPAPPTSPTEES